ncbi:coiled-coil domain-containing protein [Edaphocola flava]|uniref:hypothetical protein n=1 Tax=Edaphocola flava TaxID=2499629 RepID=UPI00192A2202|nr:hypothetical protein [Edaphocola flava]
MKNLITAKDNNVGKSTIVELLLWTLGCELQFDSKWTNRDCTALVYFSIGDFDYSIRRYKNQISIRADNGERIDFPKITGEFSQWFAEKVGFKALLPSRTQQLETPPPAYFFLPFYIDQKKSWLRAWDGFENLGQYDNWKSSIIKYHVGLLTPEYFNIEKDRHDKKGEQKYLQDDIKKIDVTLDIVGKYIPQISDAITTDKKKFENMTEEIREDLTSLSIQQEASLNELARLQGEYAYQMHQQSVSSSIIKELDKDYLFSVENIEGDLIDCPICGTTHDNSVYSKASILADKQEAENQLNQIISNVNSLAAKIEKTNFNIADIRDRIAIINEKYVIEDENQKTIVLSEIIENIAGKSIEFKVKETRNTKVIEENELKNQLSSLKKAQKDILKEIDEEAIMVDFNNFFNEYIKFLGADDINASEITSPLSYNKVSKEGGAAENVRAMLAYYLTVYNLIVNYGQDIKAPLIIDTPNQHEQSNTNYEKIIQLLLDKYPKNNQIFLCAMENSQIDKYKTDANIIVLDANKILQQQLYNTVRAEFNFFDTGADELLR